ncbi:uncharacterized protein LOC117107096 [Anneissia japonica]|uniref:uncharacterized protein LOC117107096 n=1 Tax=Anneissia japonica TaxID=1529436 RepID=UPI00142574A4|nr:uncharacterized protein LOC117107096 [Anneissia japonica]
MTPAQPAQIQGNQRPQRSCSKKGQFAVGILLIIAATLTFIFGIVSVALPTIYYGYGGNPLWTGAVILVGAILCVRSGTIVDNKCVATGGLVMNIISIFFAIDQILWMSAAAAREDGYNEHCRYYYYDYSNYRSYYSHGYYVYDCAAEKAIDIVLIVLGVIELGLTIAAVCVLSADVCCRTTGTQTMGVMYHGGQPVIVQGGYIQSVGPAYPPQTHLIGQPGQMYVHQTAGANPSVQIQYPAGHPQQYPVGQPQQYFAGQPQYPSGQTQYPAGQASQGVPQNPPTYTAEEK